MRHLPTRTTRTRVVGALAAVLLGRKAVSTDVLTNAMPAQPISGDVSGAKVVRLVVTDGGDGIDSDHADWAGLRISC